MYETYIRNQLTELLTNYGPVYELEFDGFNAPKSVDWKAIVQLAKQLQPQILVWMGPEIATTGAELRWIGNENGQATRTTSSVGNVPNGGPSNAWYPFETNVSDRDRAELVLAPQQHGHAAQPARVDLLSLRSG